MLIQTTNGIVVLKGNKCLSIKSITQLSVISEHLCVHTKKALQYCELTD